VLLQASMKDNDIDDANQFKIVKHAMDVIAISDEEQAAIFNLIASVLHLGNVGFSENDSNYFGSNLISENVETNIYISPIS
jgi:myosin heavy subunit